MINSYLDSFFDELEKMADLMPPPVTPQKPGEVKAPITPNQLKPKTINPSSNRGSTNYTRSNVEAPGTDVTLTAGQRAAPPPPVRV